jgi:prepilin-type N-terminal cleavage/methylation domain-containing protein
MRQPLMRTMPAAHRGSELRMRGGSAQTGFTLFELIVVVCIVAVTAGMLFNRLRTYQEAAEKASMQQTAAAIKSALQMRVAAYLISGRDKEIENLPNENPVNWLQEPPAEYAGEFYADAYDRVRPGSWYFDLTRREFIYVLNQGDYFKPGPDGRKWVRYRVQIGYQEELLASGATRKILTAAGFAPIQPLSWF